MTGRSKPIDFPMEAHVRKILGKGGRVLPSDVEKFFGSEDAADEVRFGPPAERLWQFVSDFFQPKYQAEVAAGLGSFAFDMRAIFTAIEYVEVVLKYNGDVLGRESVGLLKSAECLLYRRLDLLSAADNRHNLEAALKLNREAILLLDAPHNERLRRQMHRNLVNNLVMRGHWSAVSGHLVLACQGSLEAAPDGLYFQMACWYFHLYAGQQHQVLDQIRDDLALAYAQIPAFVVQQPKKKADRDEEEQETDGVSEPIAKWHRSALDRLGVVAMLASDPMVSKARAFWQYEAVQLYRDWDLHIQHFASSEARNREIGRLMDFLSELEYRTRAMPQPNPHHYNVEDQSLDVREAVKRYSLATEVYCRNLIRDISPKDEPIWWQYVSNGLAWAVARNVSVEDGLKEFDRCQGRLPFSPRTEAQRAAHGRFLCRKASLLNQAGLHGKVEPLLQQAAIHAGRTADLVEMERIADLRARTRSFLDLRANKNEAANISATIKHSFPNLVTTLFDRQRPDTSTRPLRLLLRGEAGELDKTQDAFDALSRFQNDSNEVHNIDAEDLQDFFSWSMPLVARRAVREAAEIILRHSHDPEVRRITAEHYLVILADAQRSLEGRARDRFLHQFVRTLPAVLSGLQISNAEDVAKIVADLKEGEWRDDLTQSEQQCSRHDGSDVEEVQQQTTHSDASYLCSFSWEKVRPQLRANNACVVDFFITGELALAICISCDEIKIIPIKATSQRLNAIFGRLHSLAMAAAAGNPFLGGSRTPLGILHIYSAYESESKADLLDKVWKVWLDYGKVVLPHEVEAFIKDFDLVYLSPHHTLSQYPIHLMPLADGSPLAFKKRVLYLPSINYLTRQLGEDKSGVYAAVNSKEDPDTILSALPEEEQVNHWSDSVCPTVRFAEMAKKRLVVLFMHGMYDRFYPIKTRLGFPKGARLTLADVKRSAQDFSGTELYLVGCNSGHVQSNKGQAELAFCGAFLDKKAEAALGCFWETLKDEAIAFTTVMLKHRYASRSRSTAFQQSVQEICSEVEHPMEKVLRAAPFVMYGVEST